MAPTSPPASGAELEGREAGQQMHCPTCMMVSVEAVGQAADKHCCKHFHDEIATTYMLMAAA